MVVTFDKDYLRELYETGKGDKKHRFQPEIIKRYKKVLIILNAQIKLKTYFYCLHYDMKF